MKRLIFIFTTLLILLLPCMAGAAFDYYEDFEGETVDTHFGEASCNYLYHSPGSPRANCSSYIRDDFTARYGTQYLDMVCDFVDVTETECFQSQRVHIVYGRPAGWSPCNEMKTNDDTEYWIAWSNYIPVDYYVELYAHLVFQIVANYKAALNVYYGGGFGGGAYEGETDYDGAQWKNGVQTHDSYGGLWADDMGTWVDWVVHVVWYSTSNANAVMELYRNGNLVYSNYGLSNYLGGGMKPIMVFNEYNTNINPAVYGPDICAVNTRVGRDDEYPMAPWRQVPLDEIHITEEAIDAENYCSVATPIWAATPTISFPVHEAGGYDTSFSAEFSAYADHRTDAQACFAAYRMNVEVDEDGGDWAGLVYDSGDVSSANSHAISGLSEEITYQMRVRHSSYNTARTTEYWGPWSATTDFTTTTGSAPPGTYTDILQWINFDDGTEAAGVYTLHATLEKSGNDNTGDLVNSAAINADAGIIGTDGLDCPGAADYIVFSDANDTDCDPAEGVWAAWIDFNTWTAGGVIFRVYQDANNSFYVKIDSSARLRWYWTDSSNVRTTWTIEGSGLEGAGPYFLEFIWDTAGNTREVKVDNVSIDSADGSRLATIGDFAGAITEVAHGERSGAAASDFYLDNIMISNDKNRSFYVLRNETTLPSGAEAEIGSIGSAGQDGTYGIDATLTVPVYFIDGEGDPISVVWTDAALPYGYLLTETGAIDLRLYHSSPATTVAASTHWFSTHATDANYVNSMIAATMVSADLTISSIELEGGTFTSDMTIPGGENLNDNAAVVIDGSSEGLGDAVIALCDSDGVAIGVNTTTSAAGTIYASITFANSEAGYVSIGPVGGLGMPIVLSNGALTLTYAATQPTGWGQGYNEWLLEGSLVAGDRDVGSECLLSGTALTKPTETKIEADGNELSDYLWPTIGGTDILSGFTWRVLIPYPSTSPKEFTDTADYTAWLAGTGYTLPTDHYIWTEAADTDGFDASGEDGTAGNEINYDAQGFPILGSQIFGDYSIIQRFIHGSTVELGLGDTHKYSLIPVGDILKVPEGATGCTIHDDSIPGTLDLDEQVGADTLNADIIVDGDMSNAASWTEGAGWAVAAGVATKTAGTGSYLTQSAIVDGAIGTLYKITVKTDVRTAGNLYLLDGAFGPSDGTSRTFNIVGTTTVYAVKTTVSEDFKLYANGTADHVIDDVTCKQVTSDTGIFNTWITDIDLAGLAADEPVLFFNCAFEDSEAVIEAKNAADVLYFDDECQFSIVVADCFRDYASADYHLTAGSPLKDAGEAYLNVTNLDTSDFSAGVDNYSNGNLHTLTGNHDAVSDGTISKDNCLMAAADNVNGWHYTYIEKADNGMSDQADFKLTYSFYVPAAQTHTDGVKIIFNDGVVNTELAKHQGINGTWTTNTVYWSAPETATMAIYFLMSDGSVLSFIGDNDGAGDLLYLHNVVIGYDAGGVDLEGRVTPIGAGYDIGCYELPRRDGSMGMSLGLSGYCPHRVDD